MHDVVIHQQNRFQQSGRRLAFRYPRHLCEDRPQRRTLDNQPQHLVLPGQQALAPSAEVPLRG